MYISKIIKLNYLFGYIYMRIEKEPQLYDIYPASIQDAISFSQGSTIIFYVNCKNTGNCGITESYKILFLKLESFTLIHSYRISSLYFIMLPPCFIYLFVITFFLKLRYLAFQAFRCLFPVLKLAAFFCTF